jgi:hypothetical protein
MPSPITFSRILALVFLCGSAPLPGQPVYRCGTLYSDAPCAGAVAIDVDDRRTPQQKAQTDAATRQAATLARQLQQERLALERAALPTARPASAATAAKPAPRKPAQAGAQAAARKSVNEPFTASSVAPLKATPRKAASAPEART